MFTLQVKFRMVDAGRDIGTAADAVTSLLSTWRWNGQIVGEWPIAATKAGITAYASALERSSLSRKFANEYVKSEMSKLSAVGLSRPTVQVLGSDPESDRLCSCRNRESLILFTTFLTVGSPLRCGLCLGMVPFYRIPPTDRCEYSSIMSWEAAYKACDTLQIGCGAGERFGERQLQDFESPLSREGRKLCSRIEEATGTPTYYYLCRFRGRSLRLERERKCPNCSHRWLLEKRRHKLVDFQCETCRLVSSIAYDLPWVQLTRTALR